MHKISFSAGLFAACIAAATAQNAPTMVNNYQIDLNKVQDDKLTVEFYPAPSKEKTASFMLPRMVPGTYAVYDFSRFASGVEAFTKSGKKLKVTRSDDGQSWIIKKAHKLAKISYQIEDTWDTDKSNVIFEPAGTNLDAANKVFVLNTHGVFGYLKGRDKEPLTVGVEYPKGLYGSTALERLGTATNSDIFKAGSYHELVDAPIMYAAPDTVSFSTGGMKVLIHTYSPSGAVKSASLIKDIQPIVTEQVKYLGGTSPVDKYVFIIYLNKEGESYLSGAAGALEHSHSSFYCLFEGESSAIAGMVRDVAAHEFFHIVTPLFIHSEEIQYFDFAEPKMSKHLWLYEGYTEYCAQHMQTFQNLRTTEDFLGSMADKLRTSKSLNDKISFTELSLGALDKYKSQYSNVYLKGALLNMGLDIYLNQQSEGKYNMRQLMKDLAVFYGKDKPFKDEELFAKIEQVALASGSFKADTKIKNWLETYIGGTTPLNYTELMATVGILYEQEGKTKEVSKFGIADLQNGLDFDFKKSMLKIKSNDALDEFGAKDLGLQAGDLIQYWNGKEVTLKTVNAVLGAHDGAAKKGDKLTIGVLRPNANGDFEPKELTATIREIEAVKKHVFSPMPNPTAEQLKLRKAWLNQ